MNKVLISTITLSSRNMKDLYDQLDELALKAKGDGRIYQRGEFYEPVSGYVAVEVYVFVTEQEIMKHAALDSFEDNEETTKTFH